jgi:1,4-alpha-glucan branching enzyme
MTAAKGSASAVSPGEIDRLVAGLHHNPHSLLGAHPVDGGIAIRALRPLATSVTVVLADGRRFPAAHVRQGVFAATLPLAEIPDYRLAVTYPGDGTGQAGDGTGQADDGTGQAHAGDGTGQADAGPPVRTGELLVDDPYRHLPTLGEVDLHLIGEGRHE